MANVERKKLHVCITPSNIIDPTANKYWIKWSHFKTQLWKKDLRHYSLLMKVEILTSGLHHLYCTVLLAIVGQKQTEWQECCASRNVWRETSLELKCQLEAKIPWTRVEKLLIKKKKKKQNSVNRHWGIYLLRLGAGQFLAGNDMGPSWLCACEVQCRVHMIYLTLVCLCLVTISCNCLTDTLLIIQLILLDVERWKKATLSWNSTKIVHFLQTKQYFLIPRIMLS